MQTLSLKRPDTLKKISTNPPFFASSACLAVALAKAGELCEKNAFAFAFTYP